MRVLSLAIATLLQTAAAEFGRDAESNDAAPPPLRKRSNPKRRTLQQMQQTFGTTQKGKERYDQYLGLAREGPKEWIARNRRGLQDIEDMMEEEEEKERGLQEMSMSMSMPMTDMCEFCPDGLDDPNLVLPTDDGSTCGTAKAFADMLEPDDVMCETVKLAEFLCCPPKPETTEATEAATTEAPTTTDAPADTTTDAPDTTPEATGAPPVEPELPIEPPSICSCSPLEYTFQLDLSQDCSMDTLEGSSGIGLTFCFLGSHSPGDGSFTRRLAGSRALGQLKETRVIMEGPSGSRALTSDELEQVRQLQDTIDVISVQFLEFDTTGELIVINQDDTYANVSLASGDIVSFKSISNDLDPSVSIEDQLDYLPGGVQMTVRGRMTSEETGEEMIVSNRVTWSYTNDCEVEPIEVGDAIGWVTVVSRFVVIFEVVWLHG